jgi:hypothetical protein
MQQQQQKRTLPAFLCDSLLKIVKKNKKNKIAAVSSSVVSGSGTAV